MTRISLSRISPSRARADAVVVFCSEGGSAPEGLPAGELARALARVMKVEGFKGKEGETIVWHAPASFPASRYLVVGCGGKDELHLETVRRLFAGLGRRFEGKRLSWAAPLPRAAGDGPEAIAAAAEGTLMGEYHWQAYIGRANGAKRPATGRLTLLAPPGGARAQALRRAVIACRAANLARDLVCEPPSSMTPKAMERHARRIARAAGLSLRVLDRRAAERLGMGCMLGVARGSAEPPRVLHLTYRPRGAGRRRKRLVLVGKGITFDSGGLSLKPATSMETMKTDMAGAASVLATLSALRELGCRAEVHGIMMMTENMPSGSAYKPGDILRCMDGKTVEIINTDAEGRLILADGLAYARRLKPDAMIDIATLTGACVVALGHLCTGVFTFDDQLAARVLEAAEATGEKMWRLPMIPEYRQLLDSKVADIKHVGNRWGGAITAAHFLAEFAGRDIPWVHLDIAGPAYAESDLPLARVGGTGHPVRTLLRLAVAYA